MKLIFTFALALAAAHLARAEDFVFETRLARLVVRPDAVAASLVEKQTGRELLSPQGRAFAAVRKEGRLFPASAAARGGDLLRVTFGASGVTAEYRVTARDEYIAVELTALHGEGIQEIRLLQLAVPLANAGGVLGMRWDADFAVCLMGLGPRVDTGVEGPVLRASVYPEFAMQGERVALIATPTPRFLETVRVVERDFRLPSPTLGGAPAKLSRDARTSYLFTDLTEANAAETIRYAKQGGFRYILVYSDTWSGSLGSYPVNTRNFPGGEKSLKAVIDRCHAAGLKVGMHMLTSFVGKNDPLVRPTPSPWLLKDAETTLAKDVDETATQLPATAPLAGFPVEPGPYGPARDILIDAEIVHYNAAGLSQCARGFAGTRPAPHKAGAKIYHLAEREGSYLADLKTPLPDAIAGRVAGLIDRCGFDMIYFDGGETNGANGPPWYWMGPQQMRIWEKTKRSLLVQGSGTTAWTWHIFARGTCDDTPAVAVKEYVDFHKIADSWRSYHDDFLPADLGWAGFFTDAPDHPATTPDEVEYYAVRMLALDSAMSLETNLQALKANGRTGEMLRLLGEYEQLRLGGAVPPATRRKLATGEWHRTKAGEFHPVRYDTQRVSGQAEVTLRNEYAEQPLKFRLRAAPALATVGDPSNIALLRSGPAVEIPPPDLRSVLPGSLARRFLLTNPGPLDLTSHRALAARLEVEGLPSDSRGVPVLNIQLETGDRAYRDYYVNLTVNGPQTVLLAEPGTERMLAEFRPASANYAFKAAMGGFNYGNIVALNLRWMRYPQGSAVRCRIRFVEALQEQSANLRAVEISQGSSTIAIPGAMKTGDYAEYWADQTLRVFDRNGMPISASTVVNAGPQLAPGENRLTLKATGSGTFVLTSITLGK